MGSLEACLEVRQCKYSLTLLSKVHGGKECQWFQSVFLAFIRRLTASVNLGGLEGRLGNRAMSVWFNYSKQSQALE